EPIREPDARDLAQRRVRLTRGDRRDARADAALLGRAGEGGRLQLSTLLGAALANQLVDGGHRILVSQRNATGTVSHRSCRIGRKKGRGSAGLPPTAAW